MKRVLVTGASGFIGRHVIEPLSARGFEVHAAGIGPAPDAPTGVAWHPVDLLDAPSAGAIVRQVRPTHLLHLAWYGVPGAFWNAPENDAWVSASSRLFDAALDAGVQRIVGVGSCAEYDWSNGACDEQSTPLEPATRYGRAKVAAWHALSARASTLPGGVAWGRVFFLYGPHEHPSRLVASIMCAVLRGEPALVSLGQQRRDFLFVGDVGAALAALTDSSIDGPVNISGGEAITVRHLARRAAAAAGRPDLLRIGAIPSRPDDPPLIVGLRGRLWKEGGWQPRVGLADGLHQAACFWRRTAPCS